MKKILSIVLVMIISLILTYQAVASDVERLCDNADIISDENEEIILGYLNEKSEELQFDFTVLTEETINGADVVAYADDYFDSHGFGYGEDYDGILLLIVMDTREWAFSTSGFGITVFGTHELDGLESSMLDGLSSGNYAQGIYNYAQTAAYYVDYAKTYGYSFSEDGYYTDDYYVPTEREPMPLTQKLAISGVIGLIVSLIVILVMRGKMNTVRRNKTANSYVKHGSFRMTRSRDDFINKTVTRTLRVQNESRSSHHGGGSSHVSSSGRSHGGSHGHF